MTGYRFSIAPLTTLALNPVQMIDLAVATGYEAIGIRMIPVAPCGVAWPLMHDVALMRETKARLADTGTEVVDIELIKLTPEVDIAAHERFMAAGAQIGARRVVTQGYDPDRARTLDNYARLCELAAPYGLGVDIEFPTWIDLPDLAGAAAMVAAAGQLNGGVLIDALHFYRCGATPADLEALPPSWFGFMQICDAPLQAPATRDEVIHFAREARLFPGDGELDLAGLMRRLPRDLWVAVECPSTAYVQRHGYEALLTASLAATRRVLAEV